MVKNKNLLVNRNTEYGDKCIVCFKYATLHTERQGFFFY